MNVEGECCERRGGSAVNIEGECCGPRGGAL